MVTYLPPEMMEKILSRLPVKSLLRFKSACKPWNALISSHPFIRTHLLHSSQSHALFIRQLLWSSEKQNLLRFQDGQFHVHPPPENPKQNLIFHCSCNGILLLENSSSTLGDLILWNPSMRKITQLFLPLEVRKIAQHHPVRGGGRKYGLCYDPTTVDLKVVVFYGDFNYAVYSCKNKSWSKHESEVIATDIINSICARDMACVDGATYWRIIHRFDGDLDLLCVESEGDKLKMVQMPSDLKKGKSDLKVVKSDWLKMVGKSDWLKMMEGDLKVMEIDWVFLIILRGRLCVWWWCKSVVRIWMREEDEVWRDFMRIEDIPLPSYKYGDNPWYGDVDVGENNEITICLTYTNRIVVHHLRQKTYQEFHWPLNENAVIPNQLSCVDSLLFFDQHPAGESAAYLLMQMQAP